MKQQTQRYPTNPHAGSLICLERVGHPATLLRRSGATEQFILDCDPAFVRVHTIPAIPAGRTAESVPASKEATG